MKNNYFLKYPTISEIKLKPSSDNDDSKFSLEVKKIGEDGYRGLDIDRYSPYICKAIETFIKDVHESSVLPKNFFEAISSQKTK